MHVKVTAIWKYIVSLILHITNFHYFSILDFKLLFLRLKAGMRFKVLHDESKTKCYAVEISWVKKTLITSWKSIYYFACVLEIPLSATAKFSTCEKHDSKRKINSLLISTWKHQCFGHTDNFRFAGRNRGVLSSSLIITIRKTSMLLLQTWNPQSFSKEQVRTANETVISIPYKGTSRLAGYIYQS